LRQQNAPCFKPALATVHSRYLIILGASADDIKSQLLLEKLNQPHAGARVFNNGEICLPFFRTSDNLIAHLQNAPMSAGNMQKVKLLLVHSTIAIAV
jgi:hypothetical protein